MFSRILINDFNDKNENSFEKITAILLKRNEPTFYTENVQI